MDYLSFSQLHVSNLTINGLYALNKSMIDLAKPLVSEIGAIPAATLLHLEIINQNMVATMNQQLKSSFTEEVKALDKERDADIAEIRRIVSSNLRSSNAAKKSAASGLHLFLTPYWGMATLAFDIESGVVHEMLTKYMAQPEFLAAAKTLDIDAVFASLESKNNAFDIKFKSRNTEYAERESAASVIKPAAIAATMQFFTSMEQAVNYTPNDTIHALFNKIDVLRKKYHALEVAPKEAKVAASTAAN